MAFVLGSHSLSCLSTMAPGVDPVLRKVIDAALATGIQDFGFTELQVRTQAYQDQLVARGVSKTRHSTHLVQANGFGAACDAVPWSGTEFVWDWNLCYRVACAFRKASLALGTPITWGGVWDRYLGEFDGDTPMAMKMASDAYVIRNRAAGGSGFIDGPHMQLARN